MTSVPGISSVTPSTGEGEGGIAPGPRSDRTTAPRTHPGASAAAHGPWSPRNALVRFGYSRPGGGAGLLAILNDLITGLIGDYGYLAVFVLMVLESACVPVPSEVTMLFGGALASAAFAGPGQELDLTTVALLGTAGNLVGSWLAYWAGAAGGRPIVHRFGRYLLVLPHEVDRAHDWFERRGELAVFVSRLLPVIRTFISLPAGVARMPFWRFTVYTVLGCLPWTFALAWLGYALGENWTKVEGVLQPVAWAIAGVIVLIGAWWVSRRYRKVRAAYAELDASTPRTQG
jgi:membrane protein DedA with SNARE-associated domain